MRHKVLGGHAGLAIHPKVVSIVQAKSHGPIDVGRATKSFGRTAERLIKAKRRYDPDNVFRPAIPVPVGGNGGPTLAAVRARPTGASTPCAQASIPTATANAMASARTNG